MSGKFVVDSKSVRGLAKILQDTGLTEIEYQVGEQRIRVVRAASQEMVQTVPQAPAIAVPPPVQAATPATQPEPAAIKGEPVASPMVGTAYLSPELGAALFVKAGDAVKKGDTLLIVEAMKVMNPIRAPRDGKVVEVCVQDSSPVEYGEHLVILE